MKSLNIKIPLSICANMDDRGELNPQWITKFIKGYMNKEIESKPIQEFTVNYTFKIDDNVHREIKLKAIDYDIAMSEFVGRLLVKYY